MLVCFLIAMGMFLPLGVFVLWSPNGRADRFRKAILSTGLGPGLVRAVAVGWIIFGALAIALLAREAGQTFSAMVIPGFL
ncbi:hypothetical protein SAMN05192584_105212 [Streptomyces pini]|uniref:Uncharacterized protein n=2 Tax=Streptomyces pini TaxID=1520580 RepID=A0A1I3YWR6_9ACTN|nr:hypothetical protein SAMN05192584_105212 [Streptomyces pini]